MPVYGTPIEYGLNFRAYSVFSNADHVYVTDNENDKVDVFDTTGTLLTSFGETGTGDGEFLSPISIAGNSENFFIGDNRRNDVQVGMLLGETIPEFPFIGTANAPVIYQAQVSWDGIPTWTWESGGNGTGTFQRRLEEDGSWVTTTALSYSYSEITEDGIYTLYVREQSANGQWSPAANLSVNVITDSDVVPPAAAPIVSGETPTVSSTPTWTWVTGGGGSGNYRYKLSTAIYWELTTSLSYTVPASLPNGSYTLQVQETNSRGIWSDTGQHTVVINRVYTTGEYVQAVSQLGEDDGSLLYPTAIAATATEIFVADNEKQNVQVFNFNNDYLRKVAVDSSNILGIAVYINVDPIIIVSDSVLNNIRYFNTVSGALLNTIPDIKAYGLAYYNNELYAVDINNKKIKVYSGTTLQRQFGVAGLNVGQFSSPEFISVANGIVYVTDSYRKKVLKFSTAGVFSAEFDIGGAG